MSRAEGMFRVIYVVYEPIAPGLSLKSLSAIGTLISSFALAPDPQQGASWWPPSSAPHTTGWSILRWKHITKSGTRYCLICCAFSATLISWDSRHNKHPPLKTYHKEWHALCLICCAFSVTIISWDSRCVKSILCWYNITKSGTLCGLICCAVFATVVTWDSRHNKHPAHVEPFSSPSSLETQGIIRILVLI